MKLPIIGPIVGFFQEIAGKFVELQRVKAEGRIVVATAKAKAEAHVLIKRAEGEVDWENTQARNAGSSWKDEFWTLLLAIPIPFVFIPDTRPFIEEGFRALEQAPEWYLWAVAASISAAFGIRSGLFERIGGSFSKKAS